MFFNLAIAAAQTAADTVADTTGLFKTISIVGYILAALFLVLSIAIFFLFDIKGAYSYLSGRKQQKGISEMRKHQDEGNEGSIPASPSMKFGHTDSPKAKTDRKNSGNIKNRASSSVAPPPPLAPAPAPIEPPKAQSAANQSDETAALSPTPASSDFDSEGATGVLSPTNTPESAQSSAAENDASENETSVLNAGSQFGTFVIVKNVMLVHSDEIL